MDFSVVSEQEVIEKFRKAKNKRNVLRVLADLTASSKEEVAEVVGVKLINKYPWAVDD